MLNMCASSTRDVKAVTGCDLATNIAVTLHLQPSDDNRERRNRRRMSHGSRAIWIREPSSHRRINEIADLPARTLAQSTGLVNCATTRRRKMSPRVAPMDVADTDLLGCAVHGEHRPRPMTPIALWLTAAAANTREQRGLGRYFLGKQGNVLIRTGGDRIRGPDGFPHFVDGGSVSGALALSIVHSECPDYYSLFDDIMVGGTIRVHRIGRKSVTTPIDLCRLARSFWFNDVLWPGGGGIRPALRKAKAHGGLSPHLALNVRILCHRHCRQLDGPREETVRQSFPP